jgi:hypothetical protein
MVTKLQTDAIRRLTAHVRKTNKAKSLRIASLGPVSLALNGNVALITPNITGRDGEITTEGDTEWLKYTVEIIERYVNAHSEVRLYVNSEQLKGKERTDLYTVGVQEGVSFGVPVGVLRDAINAGIELYIGYNGHSAGIFGKNDAGTMLVMDCNKRKTL